jgi:hypothetical protein
MTTNNTTYTTRESNGETYYNFTNKKAFGVQVERKITHNTVESIIVNGFEGGIGYWCGHIGDNLEDGTPIREGKPKDMPLSQWATHLILEGKSVPLYVEDGDKYYQLNQEGLIKGFTQWLKRNPNLQFDGDDDAGDADCIIQIALFGEIVYG